MNARLRIYGWILVFIGALSASPKSQSQTYRVTDLGANTVGQAINGAGQIVGYYTNASGASRPFIWTSGILTDLGTLGGTGGEAFGINTPGQVVGQSNIAGDAYHHATLWSVGTVTDLGTFNQVCCSNSHANAINDTGQIVAEPQTYRVVLPLPHLSVTPVALTFSSLLVGKHSAAQPITVNNTGLIAFGFNPMTVIGDFSQTNNCGISLAAGSSCAIQVAFTPTAPGTRAGVLTVASGGTGYTVNLMGTGNIVVALTSSAPTAAVGTSVTLSWTAPGTTCSATGGFTADGWTGNLPGSGSMKVTESAVGKYTYGITCTGGGQMANAQVTVTVGLPTVNISAAPSTLTAGQASTLTWTSTFATTCTASGGGSGDGWSGTKPTSGSASVTESTSGTYTYTLTCISGEKTGQEAAVVTVNARPSSGGGGAIDKWSLLFLFATIGLKCWRRRSQPSWR
jgi:probable HAF family extracellular repeat protein